ncbi:MAG: hypothetical protein LBD24_01585 [Spirochaetaceae bacterium]|jgi:hypothetical protein|nr:hypothetical protein [Spirochaetaceae bacterium]
MKQRKRDTRIALGMLAVVLALGFVLTGCEEEDSGGGGGGGYHLKWGITDTTYNAVYSTIQNRGWTVAGSGVNWALGTGGTANSVYAYCTNNLTFVDYGDFDGSLEACINFSRSGVSAPAGLKASAHGNSGSMPLAGIFDGGGVAVLFYITKN